MASKEETLAAIAAAGRRAKPYCYWNAVDAIQGAATEVRADREVVLAAVAQNGPALEYASEEVRGDRVVVLAAEAGGARGRECG